MMAPVPQQAGRPAPSPEVSVHQPERWFPCSGPLWGCVCHSQAHGPSSAGLGLTHCRFTFMLTRSVTILLVSYHCSSKSAQAVPSGARGRIHLLVFSNFYIGAHMPWLMAWGCLDLCFYCHNFFSSGAPPASSCKDPCDHSGRTDDPPPVPTSRALI